MVKFVQVMCAEASINKYLDCIPLGVKPDDIDAAIGQLDRLSMQALDGSTKFIDMRGSELTRTHETGQFRLAFFSLPICSSICIPYTTFDQIALK